MKQIKPAKLKVKTYLLKMDNAVFIEIQKYKADLTVRQFINRAIRYFIDKKHD